MKTKWDMLQDELAEAKKQLADLQIEIDWMERTPFAANGTGVCSACGKELPTEADFAKHYIVPDPRYRNLGYCPERPPVLG